MSEILMWILLPILLAVGYHFFIVAYVWLVSLFGIELDYDRIKFPD